MTGGCTVGKAFLVGLIFSELVASNVNPVELRSHSSNNSCAQNWKQIQAKD